MWHLRASPKKQHFISIQTEFKKTVVAVRSIGARGFECEEADEGKDFRRQEKELVGVATTGRKKSRSLSCLSFEMGPKYLQHTSSL